MTTFVDAPEVDEKRLARYWADLVKRLIEEFKVFQIVLDEDDAPSMELGGAIFIRIFAPQGLQATWSQRAVEISAVLRREYGALASRVVLLVTTGSPDPSEAED